LNHYCTDISIQPISSRVNSKVLGRGYERYISSLPMCVRKVVCVSGAVVNLIAWDRSCGIERRKEVGSSLLNSQVVP